MPALVLSGGEGFWVSGGFGGRPRWTGLVGWWTSAKWAGGGKPTCQIWCIMGLWPRKQFGLLIFFDSTYIGCGVYVFFKKKTRKDFIH